jgi:phage-related protein
MPGEDPVLVSCKNSNSIVSFKRNYLYVYATKLLVQMAKQFDVIILEEAFDFLNLLDRKHAEKILYNIRKSQVERDPELLKKLSDDIWEFRTLFQGFQYRLLAFWDKTTSSETLVVSTHGFIKKTSKVPDNEVQRAIHIRAKYFADKQLNKKKS